MLYATVPGAIIMFFVVFVSSLVVGLLSVGVGLLVWLPICWVLCGVWAAVAASNSGSVQVQQGPVR